MIDVKQLNEHFPVIKEEELNKLRQRIGVKITKTVLPWVTEATIDSIRHYAEGIGDDNPLWTDSEYAEKAPFGEIIAPPSFLYATNRIISGYVGGLSGVHAMFAGTDWDWHLPIKLGTKFHVEVYLKDLIEHQTQFAGRAIQQIYHGDFFNQTGDKLAECDSWVFRTERATARERGKKYKKFNRKIYSPVEIDEILQRYQDEDVRGAQPRYWDEVTVGEELPTILKGPMTVTGFIAFVQGWGGLYIRAHKLAFRQFHNHPGVAIPNAYGIPDIPERVHWEDDFAKAVGTPAAYDYGPERISWMIHAMTNWIGDDGWLQSLKGKIVRHNPVGETIFISGTVTGKHLKNGQGIVECSLLGKNQDSENSCEAKVTVILPLKKTD